MRREIQVHFDNQGQLSWNDEIENVDEYLREIKSWALPIVKDKDSGRFFMFDMEKVVAVVVSNKSVENEGDLFRRTYATQKGEIQEGNQREYSGNDSRWPSTETGCGC